MVGKVDDLADDPQMRHAGAIVEIAADGPVSGPTIGSPVFMEGWKSVPPAAPALGQHSREISTEIGYPAEEIDRLLGPVWSGKLTKRGRSPPRKEPRNEQVT